MDDLRLLEIDLATSFQLTADGRIAWENEPVPSLGPRLCLLEGEAGAVAAVRSDVGAAEDILSIATGGPPWDEADALPARLPRLLALLEAEAPVERASGGVVYQLPNGLTHDPAVIIVRGDSKAGGKLLADLAANGMPPALVEAGFLGVGDLWPPWVVATVSGQIAATAFAARLGEAGAEIGVYTFAGFRGRGLAAAVTAAWSALPSLRGRALFYSHAAQNQSSARVTQRLGLRRIGRSVRVT